MVGIYKITSPSGKIYIGQSVDIERRFSMYKRLHQCKFQPKLYYSLRKYGTENHIFEVIEDCDIELLNERERYYQDFYDVLNGGLNCVLTKTKDRSGKASIESRKKMSNAQIENYKNGYVHPLLGKKGLENKNFGRKRTKEQCDKIKNAQIENYKNGRLKYPSRLVLDLNNGIFYDSARDCYDINSYLIKTNESSFRRKLSGFRRNDTNFIYA
jgi:group I intron endonuclease